MSQGCTTATTIRLRRIFQSWRSPNVSSSPACHPSLVLFSPFFFAPSIILAVDDCWGERNNQTHQIEGDPVRFPEGMPAFIDKLHTMGFKFGLCNDLDLSRTSRVPSRLARRQLPARLLTVPGAHSPRCSRMISIYPGHPACRPGWLGDNCQHGYSQSPVLTVPGALG